MKVLLIGGTGIISTAITELAARTDGVDLYILNRGSTPCLFECDIKLIQADISNTDQVRARIGEMKFDVVADFISYDVNCLEQKLDIFRGITGQYIFISSCAAYSYPPYTKLITEENTRTGNIVWSYGLNKTLC